MGWTDQLRSGDVSTAFLQGDKLTREPLYMKQPAQGIPGLDKSQLLLLEKEASRFLQPR